MPTKWSPVGYYIGFSLYVCVTKVGDDISLPWCKQQCGLNIAALFPTMHVYADILLHGNLEHINWNVHWCGSHGHIYIY